MPEEEPLRYSSPLDDFLTGAREGDFTVSAAFADEMIAALQEMITVFRAINEVQPFPEPPRLSDTEAARWISDRMHQSAVGEHGMLHTLDQAATTMLPKVIEALELARRRYIENEEQAMEALHLPGGDA
ncbi:hypothetical protein [Amycolatopsis sp. BJA-103]|uniref:hypothetical protein n=1 Tax=Amycolatopsis sp. BJA-103 TaxID=1911175 RepID=UPI000C77DA20|nr:hypothetical protein [Amycolatopsis sp. BJA-103]AUI59590.1 hypothetical protein BKN51_16090 [Amycolatopsis sp. BJA-103]PNE16963.1 hypothetical protein B1H26_18420 [Amycolatopsis sp. BJA-103]